jgi:uncharacterized protein YfaP (DUF2135 family)
LRILSVLLAVSLLLPLVASASNAPTVSIASNLLQNPGFETIADGQAPPWAFTGEVQFSATRQHGGTYSAWLGGYNVADDRIYQQLAIPGSAGTEVQLVFWWLVRTNEPTHPWDSMTVRVRDASGALLKDLATLDDGSAVEAWQSSQYDLSEYVGQTVRVCFEAITDDSNLTSFFVDDVELTVGAAPPGQVGASLPLVVSNLRAAGATLRDSRGRPVSALDRSDALYLDLSGLLPRTQYDLKVFDAQSQEVSSSRFTSDAKGQIPTTALAYDLGLTVGGSAPGPTLEATGRYTLIVYRLDGSVVFQRVFEVTEPTGPIVYACNSDGTASNSFLSGGGVVWAKGEYFAPGASIRLFVTSDRTEWLPDTPLADVSGGAETVTVNGSGEFLAQVWPTALGPAACDLVADVDGNAVFSEGDVVDGYMPVGFMVQRLGTGGPIQVQLACDRNRNYSDVFQTSEDVFIYINPPTQQFAHRWVRKYIVNHRDTWATGDALVDVTQGPERDTPQFGCTNQGRTLVWPAPLTPGVYDAVIDVNSNGVYDEGTDFIDNIDSFGNAVGGFLVPGARGSPDVQITAPAGGSTDVDGVITLTGTVSSATPVTWARWNVRSGTNTTSGNLTLASGQFSQEVYLFAGQNMVQVSVRNAQGADVDSITVTSGVSGVWDIHAQLVWSVDGADVDLHLVRPSGSRGSLGDCYYGDCRHEDRSTPDWGVLNDASDNPRLDIDCTTQCVGPENITLNTYNRPESHGRYTVEVHYYSDHGKGAVQPRVNLWVRGQSYQFGPVTMTNRQWWTVCTIEWPSGAVSTSGTVAAVRNAPDDAASDRFPAKGD